MVCTVMAVAKLPGSLFSVAGLLAVCVCVFFFFCVVPAVLTLFLLHWDETKIIWL